jgi:hypothetical protein
VQPADVVPLTDLTPADWLVERVTGFDGRVRDVVPGMYPAYVRIAEVPTPLPLPLLRDLLSGHTKKPGTCWFAIWEGYPLPVAWQSAPKFHLPERDHLLFAGALDDLMVIATEFVCAALEQGGAGGVVLSGIGRPVTPADYREAATLFRSRGEHQGPSLWWPEDRAWVVGNEVDSDATYVAGSRALVNDLLHAYSLQVTEVDPEDAITIDR